MKIAGFDPGGTGALCLLDGPDLIAVEDMPVFLVKRGRGSKPVLDVHGLKVILDEWAPQSIWFEQVGGRDGESASSAFNFGRIAGSAEALAKVSRARFDPVAPHIWKKELKLIGKDKDDARAMATNRWPIFAEFFRRKKDDGRAEAALIAEYGRRMLHNEGIFG